MATVTFREAANDYLKARERHEQATRDLRMAEVRQKEAERAATEAAQCLREIVAEQETTMIATKDGRALVVAYRPGADAEIQLHDDVEDLTHRGGMVEIRVDATKPRPPAVYTADETVAGETTA
jgi:hypothetical protein